MKSLKMMFISGFTLSLSSFEVSGILGVLVFYREVNLPIEKMSIIMNYEDVILSKLRRLVVTLKINRQKNH